MNLDQNKNRFLYMGRWVDRVTFRAFVYSKDSQKLANSYKEYRELIDTGLWFDEKPVDEIIGSGEESLIEKVLDEAVKPKKRGRKCRSQPNQ